MHELSIAEGIVSIIRQNVQADHLENVRAVHMTVGAYGGVIPESLEFSFQAITQGTPLEQSRLQCTIIPFVVRCLECSAETENEDGVMFCLLCGSSKTSIISGKELSVNTIELEDQPEGEP